MKTKKIIALMLSLAMVLGVAAACTTNDGGDTPAATSGTQAPDATEAPTASEDAEESVESTDAAIAQTSAYTELAVADVTDEGDKVLLYGWNDEFPGLVTNYSSVEYDQEITESNTYQTKLDQVLASGEDAPDIFVTDAEWTKKYINSENTLAVNDLGIAYSELTDMYNYTLQVAADDNNVIKGLCWQATPCGIFYNKTVAQETLGVSEPEDVAPFFADWDAVIETARTVNEASNGEKKIVSGFDDVWVAFRGNANRTQPWISNGQVTVDPVMEDYFDIAKTLKDEGLTFETSQWGAEWNANMENQTVLSYWGPMWLADFCMNMGADGTNPTKGDWGLVLGPCDFYWGGTWMMASKYCDMKASVAQIMRDIALNPDTLDTLARSGACSFVNSYSIMEGLANDPTYGVEYLGGQNAAAVLFEKAQDIDMSAIGVNDQQIMTEFSNVVNSYLNGDIATVADAEDTFIANVQELGITE